MTYLPKPGSPRSHVDTAARALTEIGNEHHSPEVTRLARTLRDSIRVVFPWSKEQAGYVVDRSRIPDLIQALQRIHDDLDDEGEI